MSEYIITPPTEIQLIQETSHHESIPRSMDAGAAYHIMLNGKHVGGAVIRLEYDYGVLEQLFVDPAVQNERIGYAAWCAIEALHPEVTVWETAIEFSNKQKIHLYVNCCGFHVTEFFNTHHPDRDGNSLELFRMEKRLPGTPESIQAQIRRITHFETIMQHASDGSPELLKALSDYYSSPAWKRDFASDEVGLLPKDLKRGVLSEDGIYDLLERFDA